MSAEAFTFVLIGIGFAVVAFRLVRHGGPGGAMFGRRSNGSIGQVDGRGRGRNRVTVAVHALARPTEAQALGLLFTGRATASVSRLGASLSRDDARAVADALDAAAAAADRPGSEAR